MQDKPLQNPTFYKVFCFDKKQLFNTAFQAGLQPPNEKFLLRFLYLDYENMMGQKKIKRCINDKLHDIHCFSFDHKTGLYCHRRKVKMFSRPFVLGKVYGMLLTPSLCANSSIRCSSILLAAKVKLAGLYVELPYPHLKENCFKSLSGDITHSA